MSATRPQLLSVLALSQHVNSPLTCAFLCLMQPQCPFLLQVLSVMSCYGMPYLMFHVHSHKLDKMTGAWLLPVVSAAKHVPERTGVVRSFRASMAVSWDAQSVHCTSRCALGKPAQHKP